MLTYHQTTEAEKYRITAWEYEGEYAIYNATPYAEQKKKGFGFANPLNHFYSFYAGEELVGFINLYEEETEVFFGIGVAPAHCGKGYGRQMTEIACTLSRRLFPGKPLYLEVRTWNTRAVRCYQKAGFRIVGEPLRQTTSLGEGLFYRMVGPIESKNPTHGFPQVGFFYIVWIWDHFSHRRHSASTSSAKRATSLLAPCR